jgi:hypothetical protein
MSECGGALHSVPDGLPSQAKPFLSSAAKPSCVSTYPTVLQKESSTTYRKQHGLSQSGKRHAVFRPRFVCRSLVSRSVPVSTSRSSSQTCRALQVLKRLLSPVTHCGGSSIPFGNLLWLLPVAVALQPLCLVASDKLRNGARVWLIGCMRQATRRLPTRFRH